MKNILFLAFVLFSSASIAQTANTTANQITKVKNGGVGTNAFSGMTTTASDNSTAVQAVIDANVATATTNNSTLGFAPFLIPNGTYNFTNGITTRPWMKFNSVGTLTFNFNGFSTSGTAIRSHNQDAPPSNNTTGNFAVADFGSWLNGNMGVIYINGPGGYTTNVTSVSGTATNSTTSLNVTSAASLPGTFPYYLRINKNSLQEIVKVTAAASNTLTIVRGQYGTYATNYVNGAPIDLVNTGRGLDVGDVQGTPQIGQYDYRNTSFSKIGINGFGTCIYQRTTNTYFAKNDDGGFVFGCPFSFQTEQYSGANSGELNSFKNWVFSGGVNSYLAGSAGTDQLFENTSMDFNSGSAIFFTSNSGYMNTQLINSHVEHCEGGITDGDIVTNNSNKTTVRNMIYISHSYITNGDSPRQAIFKGKQFLDLDGFIFGYGNPWHDATVGLFAANPDANIISFKNVQFNAFTYYQLTALSQVVNQDPFFVNSTVGAVNTANLPNWSSTVNNGITAAVDNTNVLTTYNASAKSIKFTYSGAGNYYVLNSGKFRVRPGQRLLADTTFYGGTSTGGQIQLQYIFTDSQGNLPQTTDGSANGDTLASIYNDTADPAYTGGRAWQAKMNSLRPGTVPAGYDTAQLSVTLASLNSGDIIWLTSAAVTPLN